jgi:hypothetical protein
MPRAAVPCWVVRVVAISVVALVLGSGLAGAANSTAVKSGLRGVVMRGPIKPVCDVSNPCEEPAAGLVLRFSRGGVVVARVKTGSRGGYRVTLRPGRYSVTTPNRRPGMGLQPELVRVPRGRVARVDFKLDTGIQ